MPFNPGDFYKKTDMIAKLFNKRLPILVGAEAERFFIENFRLQGFQGDSGLEAWVKRKDDNDPTRQILKKSGHLRQGIKKEVTPNNIRVVVTGVATKYADTHNFGETIKIQVTAKMKSWAWALWYQTFDSKYRAMAMQPEGKVMTIKMPQRKFIGNSKQLDKRLQAIAEREVDKINKS